ncbi:MAG: type III pantothenate kinase [Candidatus Omnitrophica bacterium]|nr:type III pantothenate kinase [Candidatus Omnitrophota bacterium]MCM8803197.1 type III pantothenate kinase [Candidatus Omnitrophota bacterium]
MNLAIDTGNKRVKIGIFRGQKVYKILTHLVFEIENFNFPDDWKKFKIKKCGISSVYPDVNLLIEKKVKEFFKIEPVFLNYKNCNLKIKIKNPEKVGVDRIVNCKGACEIFGFPVIVIDIGTAVTIDFVNKDKVFTGGFILPGPELWVDSLKNTALIKKVKKTNLKTLGDDTSSAINLGLILGLSGAIEKIVFKIIEKFNVSKLVLTGGWSEKFSKFLNFEKEIRKYLTLEGINLILNEYED